MLEFRRIAGTFISYRRDDAAGYAGRLCESLERQLGNERVFRDVDTLRPGDDFVQAIESRLAVCRVMLVVIGREWLDARTADGARRLDDPDDFVRLEVIAALARPSVLVVPVLVEGMKMPPAAALPGPLRPLARRHAVSVRDETWNADIARLVALIDNPDASWLASPDNVRRLQRAGVAAAALLLLAVIIFVARDQRNGPAEGARTLTAGAPDRVDAVTPAPGPYTIDIPRLAEAAFEDVVYTLVSGNVVARADGYELRLRVRVMNGGRYDASFWDDNFRLASDGQVLTPSSGLNETVPAHSLRYGIVVFRFDRPLTRGVLRVRHRVAAADIPLELAATGRPPVDEQAVVADSLAQAVAWRATLTPRELLDGADFSATVERASVRRFVNTLRLTVVLRLTHRGTRARSVADLRLRLAVGNDVVTPWQEPQDLIEPESTRVVDFVFDLPPTTADASLRATLGDRSVQRALSVIEPS